MHPASFEPTTLPSIKILLEEEVTFELELIVTPLLGNLRKAKFNVHSFIAF